MNATIDLKGIIKAKYGERLKGNKYWLRDVITDEDRQVFVRCGLSHAQYGRLGGMARAETAERDSQGRFK